MTTSDGREFRSFSPRQPGVVVPSESVLGRAAARVVDVLDGLIDPDYDPERAAEELEVALSGLRPLLPPGEGEVAPPESVLGDLADVVHDALNAAGVGCAEPGDEPVCFAVAEAVLAAGWSAPVVRLSDAAGEDSPWGSANLQTCGNDRCGCAVWTASPDGTDASADPGKESL